jgi:hypothetical protein
VKRKREVNGASGRGYGWTNYHALEGRLGSLMYVLPRRELGECQVSG